jgi:hypothetical protein
MAVGASPDTGNHGGSFSSPAQDAAGLSGVIAGVLDVILGTPGASAEQNRTAVKGLVADNAGALLADLGLTGKWARVGIVGLGLFVLCLPALMGRGRGGSVAAGDSRVKRVGEVFTDAGTDHEDAPSLITIP